MKTAQKKYTQFFLVVVMHKGYKEIAIFDHYLAKSLTRYKICL